MFKDLFTILSLVVFAGCAAKAKESTVPIKPKHEYKVLLKYIGKHSTILIEQGRLGKGVITVTVAVTSITNVGKEATEEVAKVILGFFNHKLTRLPLLFVHSLPLCIIYVYLVVR